MDSENRSLGRSNNSLKIIAVIVVAILAIIVIVGIVTRKPFDDKERDTGRYAQIAECFIDYPSIKIGKIKTMTRSIYNMVQKFGKWSDSKLVGTTTYLYNESGELVEQTNDVSTYMYNKLEYIYDKNHNPVESTTYTNEQVTSIYKAQYDKNNNLVDCSTFKSDAKTIINKRIFEYNSENKLQDSNWYAHDGGLAAKFIYKYQGANLIKRFLYKSDGSELNRFEYEYDASGNLVTINRYGLGKLFSTERNQFKNAKLDQTAYWDQYGEIVKSNFNIYDKKGNIIDNYDQEYDDSQNIISVLHTKYEYTFY